MIVVLYCTGTGQQIISKLQLKYSPLSRSSCRSLSYSRSPVESKAEVRSVLLLGIRADHLTSFHGLI